MRDLFNYYRERLLTKFEVDEARFNHDFNEWVIKRGYSIQSKNDFIWSVLNRLVFEAGSKGSGVKLYQNLRWLYFEMWSLLIKEEKKASHVLKLMLYCDLYLAQDDTYNILASIIGSKCCPECDKFDGMVITLDKALLTQPLPVLGCTRNTGCICCYGFRVERDLEGHPVRK